MFYCSNISKSFNSVTLVFIPAKKYIKYLYGTTWINLWESSGMSEGNIENITKSDSNLAPKFDNHHLLPDMNFNGHGLIKKIFLSLKE